jgi:serine/threonine protein phosphatase PrpC
MVTLDGAEPDLAAMGGGSSAEGSLEATDDEDALMTDEEVDVGAHDRNNQRQGGKEVDSPTTKSKQTSENDGGANLDRSGHSDGSVRSAADGATNEATTLAKKQPKATLKPPARVLFGVYEAQGQRPYMEDRYAIIEDWKFECAGKRSQNNYYNNMNNGQQEQIISDKQYIGVYDGHNGDWAASYAKEKMHTHLEKCAFIANGIAPDAPQHELEQFELGVKSSLIRSFVDLDEEILDGTKALNRRDGSTASVVLRVANHLFVAHAGDTRIVVGKRAVGHHDVRAKALTEDHKPSLPRERKRVYDEGGRVEFCGCWRVIAENRGRNVRAALAVSRAIGDIDFKRPENKGVTATPDVARVTLDDEIENVIVATDGLWDVIGDQDAVRLCRSVLRGRFSEDACREAAEALTQEALERGSSDNVTVVVCCFQH